MSETIATKMLYTADCFDVDEDYDRELDDYCEEDYDAQSPFGTRSYWDEIYAGRGDFPSDEYSWYCGWESLRREWSRVVPDHSARVLVPGVGNDPIVSGLLGSGWTHVTAFDYSPRAVKRQRELLDNYRGHRSSGAESSCVRLLVGDATDLKDDGAWTDRFDAVLEKGTLDAVYLSSREDERLRAAVAELTRVLRTGGIFFSVSGVVPKALRQELMSTEKWEWIRDGSDDLQAGCFVWRKK